MAACSVAEGERSAVPHHGHQSAESGKGDEATAPAQPESHRRMIEMLAENITSKPGA
jgi:hypothetical protein